MSSLIFPLSALGAYIDSREPYQDWLVDEAASGKEARSTWQLAPRWKFRVKAEVLNAVGRQDLQQWLGHFLRHGSGPGDSFLLQDPEDMSVTDHGFAVGDGATLTFQLQRSPLGSYSDQVGTYPQTGKPRTNFLLQSQDFTQAAWTKGTGATVVANNAQAPDGTATADCLSYDGSGAAGGTRISQNSATTPAAGKACADSIWLRSDSPLSLVLGNNLGQTATISVTSTWTRFTLAGTGTGAALLGLTLASPGGVNTAFIVHVWGAQAEIAAAATQYIATTTVALTTNPSYWPLFSDGFESVYDLSGPINVYQDGDWPGRRLLYPYARTNLLPFSQAFDNAAWTKSNVTITADNTTAPDGTTTADKFDEGAASASRSVQENTSPAEVQGELRCYSVYVKPNNLPNIIWNVATSLEGINFDLSTGLIAGTRGTVLASGVIAQPNSAYRIWFTKRVSATVGTGAQLRPCQDASYGTGLYTGTNRTFFVWGAQCEKVSHLNGPGAYIPTPSSSTVSVTDYTLGSLGAVTLAAAPPAASFLCWDGSFFRRVRFQPGLPLQRIVQFMQSTGVELISVKP